MARTTIEWCRNEDGSLGHSWPIVNGCRRISPGCGGAAGVGGCYAERLISTRLSKTPKYGGLAIFGEHGPRWTGETRLWEPDLMMPFRLRKPSKIFVADMGDLFYEEVPLEVVDRVFAVMLICCLHETRGGHTFQILTKRAARMRSYVASAPERASEIARAAARLMEDADGWCDTVESFVRENGLVHPLIWLGVSVEDQKRANERIPHLLATPAAIRFLSVEPLLEDISLESVPTNSGLAVSALGGECWGDCACDSAWGPEPGCRRNGGDGTITRKLDWVIVGGESGPGARPFDIQWARHIVDQCRDAGVPVFMKQLGARPVDSDWTVGTYAPEDERSTTAARQLGITGSPPNLLLLRDRKGGDMAEWPEDLRVREFPSYGSEENV